MLIVNDSSSCLVCSGWSIAGDEITDDWLTVLGVVGMSSRNIVFALFSFPSCPKRVCLIHYTGLYTLHTLCLKLSRVHCSRRVVCLIYTVQLKL